MMASNPEFTSLGEEAWAQATYDLSMFALGFESRASSFVEIVATQSAKKVAFGFTYAHEQAYERNRDAFIKSDAQVIDSLSDPEFQSEVRHHLAGLKVSERQDIFVDISCFNRFRLAAIVHEIFSLANSREQELVVDFAYSVAQFEKPTRGRQPNTIVGPAHPSFAGWSQGGYSSTAAVLGLGYEQDQALGVVEYLQAGEVWAFTPTSPVKEYKPEVQKANDLLLSEIPKNHVLEYDVCSPASIIATLESVVRGLSDEHSVVLVPFGPKIFVLSALIVAALRTDVAVWRVSQGSSISAVDRRASHVRIGLRVKFTKNRRSTAPY